MATENNSENIYLNPWLIKTDTFEFLFLFCVSDIYYCYRI